MDGSLTTSEECNHSRIETFKYFLVLQILMIIEQIDKHYLEKQGNKTARSGKLYVSEVAKNLLRV